MQRTRILIVGLGWPAWPWPGRYARPGSLRGDRTRGRLGGRRDRHNLLEWRTRPAGAGPGGAVAARAAEDSRQRLLDHRSACWPTSTYTSSGGRQRGQPQPGRSAPGPTGERAGAAGPHHPVPGAAGRAVQVTFDDGVLGGGVRRSSAPTAALYRSAAGRRRSADLVVRTGWRFAASTSRTTTWTVLLGRGTCS